MVLRAFTVLHREYKINAYGFLRIVVMATRRAMRPTVFFMILIHYVEGARSQYTVRVRH